jgi:hypothetical protein
MSLMVLIRCACTSTFEAATRFYSGKGLGTALLRLLNELGCKAERLRRAFANPISHSATTQSLWRKKDFLQKTDSGLPFLEFPFRGAF